MAKATLQGFKITKIDMVSAINDPGDFMATTQFEFDVHYTPDNTHAIAELTITLEMANQPEEFHIDLTLEGAFNLSGVVDTETKKDAHIMCYDVLFTAANQLIKLLVSHGGIAGFELGKVQLKRENIHFGEETENSGKIIDFPQ